MLELFSIILLIVSYSVYRPTAGRVKMFVINICIINARRKQALCSIELCTIISLSDSLSVYVFVAV